MPCASHCCWTADMNWSGRQNAVVADESADLRPERNEGDEINRAERAQKNPAREKIIRRFDVPAPKPAREPGEKSPVAGDKTVGAFRDVVRRPVTFHKRASGHCHFGFFASAAKNGFRAGINRAVGFNELNGGVKLLVRDFRELRGDAWILRRQIIHGIAGHLLPAADPQRAEIAVAVENQQRFGRRCGDTDVAFHGPTLNHRPQQKQLRGSLCHNRNCNCVLNRFWRRLRLRLGLRL